MANESDPRLEEISTKSLPLSEREENPPLVVDLPDGQKLVVGDIKAGTVIEVATWRGTGRPDSRTHRFMLGISHDEPEALVRPTKAEPEVVINKVVEPAPAIIVEAPAPMEVVELTAPIETSVDEIHTEVAETAVIEASQIVIELSDSDLEAPGTIMEIPDVISEDQQIEVEPNSVENEVLEEPSDIETIEQSDFLNGERLSSRTDLLFGASTQYIEKSIAYYPPSNPGKQLVAPLMKKKKKVNRRAFIQTGITLGGLVVIVLTFWALNMSVVHPKSGLSTATGDAKSTLMIVKSQDSYVVGENVVGDSTSQPDNPVFGVIAAAGDGVYMLNGDLGYVSVDQDDVRGRVIAIAPWWGKLASLVGL
jgi:hypothetical protein